MDQCLRVALLVGMEAIASQSNFICSPTSLRFGLALLAAGTRGSTLRELLAFLGAENTRHLAVASARLLADVNTWAQLSFAAGVFVDRAISLKPEFVSSAVSFHHAVAKSVDFKNRPAKMLAVVNSFIEKATAGRLPSVLSKDMVSRDTKVVLANGLHFKAKWARRFDPNATIEHDFLRLDGRPVLVPFLSDAGVQHAESFDGPDMGFKVLQCFYEMVDRNGRLDFRAPCFCMLVFLPHRHDGLADLLRLAVTEPDFVMRCAPRHEQFVRPCMLPKFRFSFRFDVAKVLRQLGLSAPFDKDVADLSGMVSNMPPEGLCVSAMGQKCAIEVEEQGTEAAASTYRFSSPTYGGPEASPPPPPPPMSFVADHPFMFAIVEYEKAEVLFLGHVMDPSKE